MTKEPKQVYLFTEFVRMRRPGFADLAYHNGTRYKAQWITRGTGTAVYTSTVKYKREEAEALARKWLAKRPEYTEG